MEEFQKDCPVNEILPSILPSVPLIYALGDLHGDYRLTRHIFLSLKLIDEKETWIAPEGTVVVQVGDQLDGCRPEESAFCEDPATTPQDQVDLDVIDFFTRIAPKAREKGCHVISLLGNHEILNALGEMGYVSAKSLAVPKKEFDPTKPIDPKLTPKERRVKDFEPGGVRAKELACTRLASVIIGSNLFVHGGILEGFLEKLKITDKDHFYLLNEVVRKWLLGRITHKYIAALIQAEDSPFWTRVFGYLPPDMPADHEPCHKYLKPLVQTLEVGQIIVGHTPQPYLHKVGLNATCDEKVWRIDNGAGAVFSKFDSSKLQEEIKQSRQPAVLKITNDVEYEVLILDPTPLPSFLPSIEDKREFDSEISLFTPRL